MRIPIVQGARFETDTHQPGEASYSFCRPLPASYMSEFSVIGVMVDNMDGALEVLRRGDLAVTEEEFGAEISISNRNQLPEIVQSLLRAGVYSTIGDVIDSIYQG